jgi:hypothetical protein
MKKIMITQLLCPERHCLMSGLWDDEQTNTGIVENEMFARIKLQQIEMKCFICGSEDIVIEHAVSKFKTIEEAIPKLAEMEYKQMLTREAVAIQRLFNKLHKPDLN